MPGLSESINEGSLPTPEKGGGRGRGAIARACRDERESAVIPGTTAAHASNEAYSRSSVNISMEWTSAVRESSELHEFGNRKIIRKNSPPLAFNTRKTRTEANERNLYAEVSRDCKGASHLGLDCNDDDEWEDVEGGEEEEEVDDEDEEEVQNNGEEKGNEFSEGSNFNQSNDVFNLSSLPKLFIKVNFQDTHDKGLQREPICRTVAMENPTFTDGLMIENAPKNVGARCSIPTSDVLTSTETKVSKGLFPCLIYSDNFVVNVSNIIYSFT